MNIYIVVSYNQYYHTIVQVIVKKIEKVHLSGNLGGASLFPSTPTYMLNNDHNPGNTD